MRLNHVDLQVADVDAARAFFESYFDLRVTYQRAGEIALLKDEAGMLLGVSNLFASPPPQYPSDFHIGFRLGSAAEVQGKYEEMMAGAVPIRREPQSGGPAYFFVCLAAGGIPVEVSGPREGMEAQYWQ
jgi:catechol 2,3-dioxygenase-like lactoylglutathione lyase family enzyme